MRASLTIRRRPVVGILVRDVASSVVPRLAIGSALALACALAFTQHARAADQIAPTVKDPVAPTEAVDDAAAELATLELTAETVEGVTGSTAEVVQSAAPAGEIIAPMTDSVATATAPVVETTAPIAEMTEPITDPILDTVAPVADPLLEAVPPVDDPLLDTVPPVTEWALESVQPSDTVAPVVPLEDRSRSTTVRHSPQQLIDLAVGPLESAVSAPVEPAGDQVPVALLDVTVQQPSPPVHATLVEWVGSHSRPVAELAIGVGAALGSQTSFGMGGPGTDFIQLGLLASLLLGLFMCRTMITPSFASTAGLRLLVPVPPG